jgi:hypothetical protein
MAKQIAPVSVWVNGQTKTAEYLDAYAIRVTLNESAQFYWALYAKVVDSEGVESQGEQLAQGNLSMDGADYQSWEQDDVAWDFVASQLNLTIIA